jgi:Ca2+-binding RTX toxin-like protein
MLRETPAYINFINGTVGNDVLVGNSDDNQFGNVGWGFDIAVGGEGDDTFHLTVDPVLDIIDGGDGRDLADFTNSFDAVSVDLQSGIARGVLTQGPVYLSNIEDVTGSRFNDVIVGNDMDNTLDGGTGNDTLTGGDGQDTFVFGYSSGHDTITDFDATGNDHDTIDLSLWFDSWQELRRNMEDTGDDVTIYLDDNNSITLTDVRYNDLGSSDFYFG